MIKNIVLSVIGIVYILMSVASALEGGDFDVFLDAAQKISNGENIYVGPFIKGLQYYYSPLFALILIPFTGNFFVTEFVWLLLSGFWLYRIWVLISSFFDVSILSKKEIGVWVGVSFFLITRFLLYNLVMIQVTIFLMWAILESIQLIANKKEVLGAFLLALVINIKLMPLVIVPYLLYRGKFKTVGFLVVFSLMLLYLPVIFIGYDYNAFLLSEWWSIINPGNAEHVLEAEITYQSLVGTIPVFLIETESIIQVKRNFVNLSVDTVVTITNFARLLVVGFTLYFLGTPFRKKVDKLSEIWAISYLLLAIPLIFPHQQKYAFLFMFPMISYLVYYSILRYKFNRTISFKVFVGLLGFIVIVFTPIIGSDIIGRNAYDVIQHFRILGICAFLLIPFIAIATPKSINEMISKNKG